MNLNEQIDAFYCCGMFNKCIYSMVSHNFPCTSSGGLNAAAERYIFFVDKDLSLS